MPRVRYIASISDLDAHSQTDIRRGFDHLTQTLGATDRPVVSGFCPVCGRWSYFSGAAPFRESFVCQQCFSTSRYRRMALGVLQAIRERFGVDAASLEDLPADHEQTFELLDTQTAFASPPYACYSLPDRLSSYSWINVHTSSYRPALPWGAEIGDHATNQNLEALTFEEGRFDLVMTSDVLEHVRLYEDAHREIARVVKPGGAYIFTVPHSRGMAEHLVRIAVHDRDDATADEFVLPPEYHGSADPDEGPVLSYRVFGASIDQELNDIGFDVTYGVDADPIHAIFETELFYCHRRDRTPAEPD